MKNTILTLVFGLFLVTGGKSVHSQTPEHGEQRVYKTAQDVKLSLFIHRPSTKVRDAKTPAVVFFHGGGWKSGSPKQFQPHCKYFADRGIVAVTVEYRLSSKHDVKVEDCIEDAKSSMRWVRSHAEELGIDPDRIAAGGGSAGGHLAACVALMEDFNADSDDLDVNPKPNALVLFNPFMGMTEWDGRREVGSRTHGPPEKVFPLTYASIEQPPCIMFFGTADPLKEGADFFLTQSKKSGNDCRMVTYKGQGHGFFNHGKSDGKYYRLTVAEADKFLVELGWLTAP